MHTGLTSPKIVHPTTERCAPGAGRTKTGWYGYLEGYYMHMWSMTRRISRHTTGPFYGPLDHGGPRRLRGGGGGRGGHVACRL